MPGRTIERWLRAYVDGVDWSPFVTKVGTAKWEYDIPMSAALSDPAMGGLPDLPTVSLGDMEALLFTATPTGFHDQASATPAMRTILLATGIGQVPVIGDPVFNYNFWQKNYMRPVNKGLSKVTMQFGLPSVAFGMNYIRPIGYLLHPKQVETAVNSAAYWDSGVTGGSAFGGFMCYMLFSSNGTVTLKTMDSASAGAGTGADLSGCTSGAIDASTTPQFGIVQLGKTATVRQFLRWQLVFGTATTCTFAIAFTRALRDSE